MINHPYRLGLLPLIHFCGFPCINHFLESLAKNVLNSWQVNRLGKQRRQPSLGNNEVGRPTQRNSGVSLPLPSTPISHVEWTTRLDTFQQVHLWFGTSVKNSTVACNPIYPNLPWNSSTHTPRRKNGLVITTPIKIKK